MKHRHFFCSLCLLMALPGSASLYDWRAILTQQQVTPTPVPVVDAIGFAQGTLDTHSGSLDWDIRWQDISGAVLGLHLHGPANAGSTGAIQVNVGAISGLSSASVGSAVLTATQISQLLNRDWYINLHTGLNPAGELRGQIYPHIRTWRQPPLAISEPTIVSLSLVAFLMAGLTRRR